MFLFYFINSTQLYTWIQNIAAWWTLPQTVLKLLSLGRQDSRNDEHFVADKGKGNSTIYNVPDKKVSSWTIYQFVCPKGRPRWHTVQEYMNSAFTIGIICKPIKFKSLCSSIWHVVWLRHSNIIVGMVWKPLPLLLVPSLHRWTWCDKHFFNGSVWSGIAITIVVSCVTRDLLWENVVIDW